MRQIFYLIFIILSFSAIAAENEKIDITFVYENYPPYEYPTKSLPAGDSVKTIKLICSKLGYNVKFVFAPWARALKLVRNGKVDGIFSIRKNLEREKFLAYPQSILAKAEDRIFSLNRGMEPIKRLSNLKGYSVGVVKGYSYGKKFDSVKSITKEFASENTNLIFRLEKGWLDTIVINKALFEHYINISNLSRKKFLLHPYVINENKLYVAFSKKAPLWKKFVKEFDRELQLINSAK